MSEIKSDTNKPGSLPIAGASIPNGIVIADGFERNFLFRLTRFIAVLLIIGILVAMIVGGVIAFSSWKIQTYEVQPSVVIEALKPPAMSQSGSQNGASPLGSHSDAALLAGVKIPFALQRYITAEDLNILHSWLDSVPEKRRNNFLSEMADTVIEAQKSGVDPIDAINKYHDFKVNKIALAERAEDQQRIVIIEYASFIAACIALIALLSLVLVLLAVERNTRKAE